MKFPCAGRFRINFRWELRCAIHTSTDNITRLDSKWQGVDSVCQAALKDVEPQARGCLCCQKESVAPCYPIVCVQLADYLMSIWHGFLLYERVHISSCDLICLCRVNRNPDLAAHETCRACRPLSAYLLRVKLGNHTQMPPLLFGKVHVHVYVCTRAHTYLEGCFGGCAWLTWPSSPDSSEANNRHIQ